MTQKFHIKTYGCQMNVYDSDAMAQILKNEGWQESPTAGAAEVIILNSCHIRSKAAQKIYSEVGRLRSSKKSDAVIAVAGCVAQAEGKAMMKRQKDIGLVFGPQDFHRLPQMIALAQKGERTLALDFTTQKKFSQLLDLSQARPATRDAKVSSLLTIQEGCDKFCSFCVVPWTRGMEVSRAPKEIMAEARLLVARGAAEVILLGQNVNAYAHAGWDLADLLDSLSEIENLVRLRYTTSHPLDMSAKLIEAHGTNPKLVSHLHLPIQSGSDSMLKKMNRRHTAQDYLDKVAALRQVCPDIALSSDFIVGFPEESDEDFADTLALVEKVSFSQAFSFKYSPRPGTRAADMPQVPEEIQTARLHILKKCLSDQQLAFNQTKVGQTLSLLLENPTFGKTTYGQNTLLQNAAPSSLIEEVKITKATPFGLEGVLV